MKVSENIIINIAIKLVEGIQLLYELIYTFSLIELEVLKTYIKIH